MKKTNKKAKPVPAKRKSKIIPAIEPVAAAPAPVKKQNFIVSFFKFIFGLIALPFKLFARLSLNVKRVLAVIVSVVTFLAMLHVGNVTETLAAVYALFRLPFDYIHVVRFDLALPPYFVINLIIFMLCTGWLMRGKPLPKPAVRPEEKKEKKGISIRLIIILAAYGLLVWLFLINKFYGLQNFLFFTVLVLCGLMFRKIDSQRPAVHSVRSEMPESAELGKLVLFSLLMVVVYMFDWKSWKYSFIGDEYAFFDFARNIAKGAADYKLLYEEGVYGDHPIWTSVYQSLFMHFAPFFGWKLSTAIVPAITVIPLYLWVRMVFNKTTAKVTVVSFAFALSVIGFAHLPHNVIHPVLPLAAGLLFLELAIRKNSSFWTFMAAAVMGIGCYTFYSSRLVPVVGIIYWFLHPMRKNFTWNNIIPGIMVFIGTILFIVINPEFISHMTVHSVFTGSEISNPADRPLYMVLNYFHTFFAFIYRGLMSHFVPGRTVDILSAAGILAGMTWCIMAFFRDWRARFLFLSYAVIVIFIGAIVQYNYPPNTRLTFLAPMLAVFAGVGLTRIAASIPKGRNAMKLYRTIIWAVIAGIISFSAYSFYIYLPKVFPFTAESVAIKYIQTQSGKKNVVMATTGSHMLVLLSELYGFNKRFERVMPEVFEQMVARDELRGKVAILSNEIAISKPGLQDFAKDGMVLRNELFDKMFFVYDFTDDAYYNGFKELWNTGNTSYVVTHKFTAEPVQVGRVYAPSLERHSAPAKPQAQAQPKSKIDLLAMLPKPAPRTDKMVISPAFDFKPLAVFPSSACVNTNPGAAQPVRDAKVSEVKLDGAMATPSDIAVTANGEKIIVADGIAYKIMIYSKQGDTYKLLKTIPLATSKGMFGPVDDRPDNLKEHAYLEMDNAGNSFYVSDVYKDTVKEYDLEGKELKTIVFNSFLHGSRSLALSADGSTFGVASPGKNLLVFFGKAGEVKGSYATTDGKACGQVSQPCYVGFDSALKRYVVDTINNRVQIFTPDMKFIKSFDIGLSSTILGPQIKVFDKASVPFMAISLQYSKSLLLISLDGKKARTVDLGSTGIALTGPCAMETDGSGNIFVLDPRTKVIVKVELPKEVMK